MQIQLKLQTTQSIISNYIIKAQLLLSSKLPEETGVTRILYKMELIAYEIETEGLELKEM